MSAFGGKADIISTRREALSMIAQGTSEILGTDQGPPDALPWS